MTHKPLVPHQMHLSKQRMRAAHDTTQQKNMIVTYTIVKTLRSYSIFV